MKRCMVRTTRGSRCKATAPTYERIAYVTLPNGEEQFTTLPVCTRHFHARWFTMWIPRGKR
jgi:hypothetical protein